MGKKVYQTLDKAGIEVLASDPITNLFVGRVYFNSGSNTARIYNASNAWQDLGASSGVVEVPVGTIVSYNPGYYGNGSNGSFTVTGPATNDVAGVNAYLSANWRVCDGSALNDAGSPIWNAAGRYLPNISDSRFLMGSTAAGAVGGVNTNSHTHSVTVASHSVTNNAVTSGNASVNTTTRTASVALTNNAVTSGNASVNTTTRTANVAIGNHTFTQPTVTVPQHKHGLGTLATVSATTGISLTGNANASAYSSGTARLGAGANTTTVTISSAMFSVSDPGHTHSFTGVVGASGSANDGDAIGGFSASVSGGAVDAHSVTTQPTFTVDAHTHSVTSNVTVATQPTFTVDAHTHSVTSNVAVADHGAATSGAPSDTENRPAYLAAFYIVRVK